MNRWISSRLATVVLVIATTLLATSPARGEVDGDSFVSKDWKISLTGPKNWQLSEQKSYPNVILWMKRRVPAGRILVAAERVTGKTTTEAYSKKTIAILTSLGFRVGPPRRHRRSGSIVIDFDQCPMQGACTKSRFLRQAVRVYDGIAYSFTLSAADLRTRAKHLRAFDSLLRSVEHL